MFEDSFQFGNSKITREGAPYFVAEIGLNHNNDLEFGKRTIEAAKNAGAHAVKFQTYKTAQFIDSENPKSQFLIDIFSELELSPKMHLEFQKTAKDLGLDFFSTPLDVSSLHELVSLHVPGIKIASGDITNSELLFAAAQTKLPIFLSTGAADFSEVIRALEYLKDQDVTNLCLFHCISLYPTPTNKVNAMTVKLFSELTDGPLGFSDHTDGNIAAVLCLAYGASVFEKHFTLDRNAKGPDHSISTDPVGFRSYVDTLNTAFSMKGTSSKKPNIEEVNGRFWGRRSLYKKDGKWISLRPAMHLEDDGFFDAWEWVHKK